MAERGELTLTDAAERLGVSTMTVLRLIGDGTVLAQQVCRGAPRAIPEDQIVALADAISPDIVRQQPARLRKCLIFNDVARCAS